MKVCTKAIHLLSVVITSPSRFLPSFLFYAWRFPALAIWHEARLHFVRAYPRCARHPRVGFVLPWVPHPLAADPADFAGLGPAGLDSPGLDSVGPGSAGPGSLGPAGPGSLGPAGPGSLGPAGPGSLGPAGPDSLGPCWSWFSWSCWSWFSWSCCSCCCLMARARLRL